MAELFSAGAGGPSAPGATPWYNVGGASPGAARPAAALGMDVTARGPVHIKTLPFGAGYIVTVPTGEQIWARRGAVVSPHRRELVAITGPRPGQRVAVAGYKTGGAFKHAGDVVSRAVSSVLEAPGLFGFGVGLALPFLAPWTVSVAVGATIGVAGYIAEPESWVRRFSIGAGIGGAIAGGVLVYRGIPTWDDVGMALLEGTAGVAGSIPGVSHALRATDWLWEHMPLFAAGF